MWATGRTRQLGKRRWGLNPLPPPTPCHPPACSLQGRPKAERGGAESAGRRRGQQPRRRALAGGRPLTELCAARLPPAAQGLLQVGADEGGVGARIRLHALLLPHALEHLHCTLVVAAGGKAARAAGSRQRAAAAARGVRWCGAGAPSPLDGGPALWPACRARLLCSGRAAASSSKQPRHGPGGAGRSGRRGPPHAPMPLLPLPPLAHFRVRPVAGREASKQPPGAPSCPATTRTPAASPRAPAPPHSPGAEPSPQGHQRGECRLV